MDTMEAQGVQDIPDTREVFARLEQAVGPLSENIVSVVPVLPLAVKRAIVAATSDDQVRDAYDRYLAGERANLSSGISNEVDAYRRNHGHRHVERVEATLSGN